MAMKLSTGKVAFPIEFDNGDKDCIYFNPNDPNLSIRLTDFQDKITERLKEFDDIEFVKVNTDNINSQLFFNVLSEDGRENIKVYSAV